MGIGPHGHPTGYQRGCEQCKAERKAIAAKRRRTPAYRRYRAEQRRAQRAKQYNVVALSSVSTSGSTTGTVEIGPNEQAVIAQCERLPKSDESPSTVMQARTLARILDCPEMSHDWPTTSRQLHALLMSMSGPRKKLNRRLAAVQLAYSDPNRWKREAQ